MSGDSLSSTLVEQYIVLWDILADDDEDVRNAGARIASKVLSNPQSNNKDQKYRHCSLSAPAARHKLIHLITRHYQHSESLWNEALQRLKALRSTQQKVPEASHITQACALSSFSIMFEQARTPDTALFVEEKQNLYIDEVEEARVWANFLCDVNSAGKAHVLETTLTRWTTDGLGILLQTIDHEKDGPIGWGSNPEVFTLGMRVIFGAKVLIFHAIEAEKCKEMLWRILQIGAENQLHPLWEAEMRDVLRVPKDS